ncbi:MAG: hypothetical protein MJE63_19805 [Proteobacteria bacterium]|nr:hypothetical protein [Pseudomonadota bacterium]
MHGGVAIEGELTVSSGITANGTTIKANKGVTVLEGATIQTGTLHVANGADLNVSGAMTIANGADLSDGTLNVSSAATLNVEGSFNATNGATISGADLTVSSSATIGGSLSVSDGIAVSGGDLTTTQGGSIGGRLNLNGGATVNGGELNVNQGAMFDGSGTVDGVAATFSGGEIKSNGGITVNSGNLVAMGDAIFSGANGVTVNSGTLKAESGATISGGELIAMDGVTVSGANGVTVSNGELKAQNGATISGAQGVTITGGELKAQNGATISGSSGVIVSGGLLDARNGAVFSGGTLLAQSGAVISGAACQIENGALVQSNLNAPDIVDLGTTTVDSLNVKGALTAKKIEFDSVDLKTLNAENANIRNLATEGGLTIDSQFAANNNVLLGNEKLIINYEGPSDETATVNMVHGIVGKPGHFLISITGSTVTITFDDQSKIKNLMDDWNAFKRDNAGLSSGFYFFRVGSNPWKPQTVTEVLRSSQIPIKQYRISRNGIRTIYSGAEITSPSLKVEANSDLVDENFDFAIVGSTLTVKYPNVIAYRTAGKLVEDWITWKSSKGSNAGYFDIQQTGDSSWLIGNVSGQKLALANEVIRRFTLDSLNIRHTSGDDISDLPDITIKSATQNGSDNPSIVVSLTEIEITLGKVGNSAGAVYNAWEVFVQDGNNLYDFEIEYSNSTVALALQRQAVMSLVDESDTRNSQAFLNGYNVTYQGDGALDAKIQIQQGTSNTDFVISANDATKTLTISYPVSVSSRTITNLMSAWGDVLETDRHGFDVIQSSTGGSDDFFVELKQEIPASPILVYREYKTSSPGVDGIVVRHAGADNHEPDITIQSGGVGFNVQVIGTSLIIDYPSNGSGTIDQLMKVWNEYGSKGGFTVTKQDISEAIVNDETGSLSATMPEKTFHKGAIRFNTVVINGKLRFGDSDIELKGISRNPTLDEGSDRMIPTQAAVKSFVETRALLGGDPAQAFETANLTVNGNLITEISNDTGLSGSSNTAVPTENAVKSYADTKALLAGGSGQNFTVADLTVHGGFGFNETVTKLTKVSADLDSETDLAVVMPNGTAVAAYADKKALLAGDQNQPFSTSNLTVNGDFGFLNGHLINQISNDTTLINSSESAIPTEKAVKTYTDSSLSTFSGSTTVDFNAQNLVVSGTLGFNGTILTSLSSDIATETAPTTSIPSTAAVTSYIDSINTADRSANLDYDANNIVISGEFGFDDNTIRVSKITDSIAVETEPNTSIPNTTAVINYINSTTTTNRSSNLDYNANNVIVSGEFGFDDTTARVTKIADSIAGEATPASAIPTVEAVQSYSDTGKADINGASDQEFNTAALTVGGNLTFASTIFSAVSTDLSNSTGLDQAIPRADAVKSYVDANTASISGLQNQIDAKPGLTIPYTTGLVVATAAESLVSSLSLDSNSRGMLMVHVTDGSSAITSGLYAIHGNNSVSKIAGDGFSDKPTGNPGASTYNLFYSGGTLTMGNTTAVAITVHFTYFGA